MRVLLHGSDLRGHLRVYMAVIAGSLADDGHEVFVCLGENSSCKSDTDWNEQLPRTKSIFVLDIDPQLTGETVDGINHVIDENQIDQLLMCDADGLAPALVEMADGMRGRFHCPAQGIFAFTADWYPGESMYFPLPMSLGARVLKGLRALKYSMDPKHPTTIQKREQRRLFDHALLDKNVLDGLICKDERLAIRYPDRFQWMPEIFGDIEEGEQDPLADAELPILDAMRSAQQSGRPILLFYGTGNWYKGYDFFLELAARDPECLAVHIGLPERNVRKRVFAFDTVANRQRLLDQNRLLQSGCFATNAMTDLAFQLINVYVSVHRLSGSSGTVLSAAAAGTPILSPNQGLLGFNTRQYHLGATYQAMNIDDMTRRWNMFKHVSKETFAKSLREFSDKNSRQSAEQFFRDSVKRVGDNATRQANCQSSENNSVINDPAAS